VAKTGESTASDEPVMVMNMGKGKEGVVIEKVAGSA
jgi:hypothetical protein